MTTWRERLDATPEVPQDILRWWLSDHTDCPLTALPLGETLTVEEEAAFAAAAGRLAAGEPVQYVCGRAPFRHLTLQVDARVLIPRPETEQLVQLALDHALKPGDRVLDVGTGSGCIALALKQERPDLQVEGCDLSGDALEVARHNAECLGLDVPFRQADLLAGEAPGSREVILSNPPYIDPEERSTLPENVRAFEPEIALFAPGAGRELLEKLIAQAREVLVPGGHLFMETGETQHPRLLEIAQAAGWRARSLRDLAGRDRFIWLTRP